MFAGADTSASQRPPAPAPAPVGLGLVVALHRRASTVYQIHEGPRCLYFWSDSATEPQVPAPDLLGMFQQTFPPAPARLDEGSVILRRRFAAR
jgi:hypothetical protein